MYFLFLFIWLPSLSSGEGINLTYFISKNETMMLKCEIPDDFCCSDINKIEFFKNGDGVCTFKDCRPFFDVPLDREHTRFYRCGCSVNNVRKTHLITTELMETDYGNWSCACSCGDVRCRSNTISILPPASHEENVSSVYIHDQDESDIAPVSTHEAESRLSKCLVVTLVITPLLISGVFLCILFVARCHISRRVNIVRENWLTRLCLGRVQDEQDTESNKHTSSADTSNRSIDLQEYTRETISGKQEKRNGCIGSNSFNKPEWCICSECKDREQKSERLCCNRVECITRHQDFESSCFRDIDVTPSNDSEKQREKRIRAYENYNKWMYGIIDTEQRSITLPACCVGKIRNKFPDPKGHYRDINIRICFPGITQV